MIVILIIIFFGSEEGLIEIMLVDEDFEIFMNRFKVGWKIYLLLLLKNVLMNDF